MRSSFEVVMLFFFGAVLCLGPILIAAMVWYGFAVKRPREREALAGLAAQLGLTAFDDPRRGRRYAGVHRGFGFDIGTGVTKSSYVGTERIQRRYGNAVQIVVHVAAPNPPRGYAGCNRVPGEHEGYAEAFRKARQGMETLSPASQAAMLGFLRKYGYIWVTGTPLDPSVAYDPRSAVRIEVTLARMDPPPEEVRTALDNLVNVAETFLR